MWSGRLESLVLTIEFFGEEVTLMAVNRQALMMLIIWGRVALSDMVVQDCRKRHTNNEE